MTLRLPIAGNFYSQSDQQAVRSELEREDLRNAKLNADAIFNNLSIGGNAVFAGDVTVNGNFSLVNLSLSGTLDVGGAATFGSTASFAGVATFSIGWSLPPTIVINGVNCARAALLNVINTLVGTGLVWCSPPPGAVAGIPSWQALTMAHLPDYIPQCAPDATVTTVANTIVRTALGQVINIPANSLAIGDCLRMTCRGVYGCAAAIPTLALEVRNISGGNITGTGVNALGAASLANRGWEVQADFIVTALGGLTGRVEAQGRATLSTSATAAQSIDMVNTGTATLNTTIAQSLQLFATWGTANAANSIICRQTIWELIKA